MEPRLRQLSHFSLATFMLAISLFNGALFWDHRADSLFPAQLLALAGFVFAGAMALTHIKLGWAIRPGDPDAD